MAPIYTWWVTTWIVVEELTPVLNYVTLLLLDITALVTSLNNGEPIKISIYGNISIIPYSKKNQTPHLNMFIQFSDIFPISMAIFCCCSTQIYGLLPREAPGAPDVGAVGLPVIGKPLQLHRPKRPAIGLDDWMGC